MRVRRAAVVALLLAGATACSPDSDASSGPPPTVRPVSTTDPAFAGTPAGPDVIGAPTAEVVVLDAGSEPRRPLRFDPAVGVVEAVTMSMDQGSTVGIGGVVRAVTAAFEMDLTHTVEAVDADTFTYVTQVDDVRWAADLDPALVGEYERMRSEVTGRSSRVVVDRRGQLLAEDSASLTSGDALADDIAHQIETQAGAMSAPFPEEAVGMGAIWEVRGSLVASGLTFRVVTTYEITDLTDERVVTATRQVMTIPPGIQTMMGQSVQIGGGEIAGDGVMSWDLGLPIAVGEMSTAGDITMSITAGDQSGQITLSQRQHVETKLR